MITTIEIENLRGIRTGRLEGLSPLTILTGPNGCGKSTVLDALLIGASPDPAAGLVRAVQRHPVTLAGGSWLFGRPERPARVTVKDDSGRAWPYVVRLHQTKPRESLIEITGQRENFSFKSAFVTFAVDNTAQNGNVKGDLSDSPVDFVRLIDPGIASSLHELFTLAARTFQKDYVEALLNELIPKFKGLLILTEGDTPFLALSTETSVAPVSLAGDGIQALVQIALEIAAVPGGLVLIEEPEVYQHPGAISQTAKAILANARRGVQVVLTTHSLELIDALLSEATQEDVTKMAVFNLLLRDGELLHGRRLGGEITFARQNMESDLR